MVAERVKYGKNAIFLRGSRNKLADEIIECLEGSDSSKAVHWKNQDFTPYIKLAIHVTKHVAKTLTPKRLKNTWKDFKMKLHTKV